MTQAAGKTGTGPTVSVAIEQHFPLQQRLIDDNLAYAILPFAMRAVVGLTRPAFIRDWMIRSIEKPAPGIWGGLMCRKRYIDEKLLAAVAQIDAVVNLGAGFDTRAYRLPALAALPVWEIDQPENITAKRDRLQKLFGAVPAHVTLVPLDFDHEALDTVLTKHGYTPNKRTFFIWEAVTQYLTEAGVKATFEFLAQAASGSLLSFTYIRKDFLEGRVMYDQASLYKQYVAPKIWRFGLAPEEVADFLSAYGWRIIEHLGYDELAERYVKPTGRALATTPLEQMVYAQKL